MKKARNYVINILLIVGFTAGVLWFTLKAVSYTHLAGQRNGWPGRSLYQLEGKEEAQ